MVKKNILIDYLSRIEPPKWLLVVLILVIILRIPSFFEPYSYGDEMIYLTLGEAVRQGVPLYKDIHDNKPPLLYLTAALAGNLFWFKFLLAGFNLASIVLFWKLLKAIFPGKEKLHKVGTFIFAILTTIPLLEGNIANAEMFMIAFTIGGFLILFSRKLTPVNLVFSGVLFSLAALFKIPAAFDIPAIIFYWLITVGLNRKNIITVLKHSILLAIGFTIPIAVTFVWYYANGAFKEYFIAAFAQNFGYVSSWRPTDVQKPFLEKNLPLIIRGLIVLAGSIILFWKRKVLSKQFIFFTLWLLFALFAVTLSERPYPHYLIQAVAPISVLLAIFFTDKTLEQSLAILPLGLAAFVPFYFHFWHYPTFSYYVRFAKFATGNISQADYLKSFGENTLDNYQIAKYVRENTKETDRIFVSGDSTVIYALAKRLPPGKYAADYHIHDFFSVEKQAELIRNVKPKFIILLREGDRYSQLDPFLKKYYLPLNIVKGVNIWRLKS